MELLVGRETFLLNFIYKYVGITLSSHLDSLEFRNQIHRVRNQNVSACKNDESQYKVH